MNNSNFIKKIKSQINIIRKRSSVGYFVKILNNNFGFDIVLFPYKVFNEYILSFITSYLSRNNKFLHWDTNIAKLHNISLPSLM